jgi:hypothetical protein
MRIFWRCLSVFIRDCLISAAMLLCASGAFAQNANNVVTPKTPKDANQQFLQGTDSAGTYKTVYTGGTNGSIVKGLWETNNDASATHLITCQIKSGSVLYGGLAITSVESAGFANATPAQNLMAPANWPGLPVDSDGNPFLFLISGDILECTFATSITSSDLINVTAIVADF